MSQDRAAEPKDPVRENLGELLQAQVTLATIGTALLGIAPDRLGSIAPFLPGLALMLSGFAVYGAFATVIELADGAWSKFLNPLEPLATLTYILVAFYVIMFLITSHWRY